MIWVYALTCLSESMHCVNLCLHSASALHPGCYLFGLEPRWDPCVLLRGAARIIVRDGVSLKVWYELRHHLFQLARNWTHCMLLSHTLAVHTDLPVETETALGLIPGGFLFWLIYSMSQNWSYVKSPISKCSRTDEFSWCFQLSVHFWTWRLEMSPLFL